MGCHLQLWPGMRRRGRTVTGRRLRFSMLFWFDGRQSSAVSSATRVSREQALRKRLETRSQYSAPKSPSSSAHWCIRVNATSRSTEVRGGRDEDLRMPSA